MNSKLKYVVVDPDGNAMPNTITTSPNKSINLLADSTKEDIEIKGEELYDAGYIVKEIDFTNFDLTNGNPITPEMFSQQYEMQSLKG